MKEELLLLLRSLLNVWNDRKNFSISDIEKSYNLERKKLGKSAVKLTNMERLTIESRLLKIRFYNEHIK